MSVIIDTESELNDYALYAKPLLSQLLAALKLNKTYVRASGSYLYYRNETQHEIEVIDYAGGYGSVILGHNPPALIAEAVRLLESNVPVHAQMSIRNKTGALTKAISDRVSAVIGSPCVTTLTNTGAEAVEAALKHARLVYFKKLEAYRNKVSVSLANIESFFLASNRDLNKSIEVNGAAYSSWYAFKRKVKSEVEDILDNLSPCVLAAEGAFHGKTLAALSVTFRADFREPFLPSHKETVFFPHDIQSIEDIVLRAQKKIRIPNLSMTNEIEFEEHGFSEFLAIIIEPILGEGGARPFTDEIFIAIDRLSTAYAIPVIVDEVQSGIYRTGYFLASSQTALRADYYLLGKSLGGGVAKIAAFTASKTVYQEEFGLKHSSTFAEDDFSSAIASKALALIEDQKDKIESTSEQLLYQLTSLKKRFPRVIRSVHGKGLMLGVELRDFEFSKSYALQMLTRSRYLSYVYASFLLNNFNIRVAPMLAQGATLRIQPPLTISREDIHHLVAALTGLCEVIEAEDVYKLIECILPTDERNKRPLEKFSHGEVERISNKKNRASVGFVAHYIDVAQLRIADPSLVNLSNKAIESILEDFLCVASPIFLGQQVISNSVGKQVIVNFSGLCFTSSMAERALREKRTSPYVSLCHKAVRFLGGEMQVGVVGLGQYTSILTQDGKNIPETELKITTGNSLTVYMGLQALLKQITDHGLSPDGVRLGIIGAGGNINSVYAQMITPNVRELFLLGGQQVSSEKKAARCAGQVIRFVFEQLLSGLSPLSPLQKILSRTQLYKNYNDRITPLQLWNGLFSELGDRNPIKVIKSLERIKECNAVVVGTNSSRAFLGLEHFSSGTIVFDISVPTNCKQELIDSKEISLIYGGVVGLPHRESILIRGFPLAEGKAYACMSETLLLGFEKNYSGCTTGNIKAMEVQRIGKLSQINGFYCADAKIQLSF